MLAGNELSLRIKFASDLIGGKIKMPIRQYANRNGLGIAWHAHPRQSSMRNDMTGARRDSDDFPYAAIEIGSDEPATRHHGLTL